MADEESRSRDDIRSGQSSDTMITFQPVARSVAPVYLKVGDKFSDTLHVSSTKGGADWIPGAPVNFEVRVADEESRSPDDKPSDQTVSQCGGWNGLGWGDLLLLSFMEELFRG
ncbi:hypothetical protein ABH924_003277 [Arthrobacter sp. GAS37]|uniref:hypothetical protein n=1 Tax=Arthrobacter sp. GAS37 TaxID=3156261 RepID=UPI00383656C1